MFKILYLHRIIFFILGFLQVLNTYSSDSILTPEIIEKHNFLAKTQLRTDPSIFSETTNNDLTPEKEFLRTRKIPQCDENLKKFFLIGFKSKRVMYPRHTDSVLRKICPFVEYGCCTKSELVKLSRQFQLKARKFDLIIKSKIKKVETIFNFRNDHFGFSLEFNRALIYSEIFDVFYPKKKTGNIFADSRKMLTEFSKGLFFLQNQLTVFYSGFVCSICNGQEQDYYKLTSFGIETHLQVIHNQQTCLPFFELYVSLEKVFNVLSDLFLMISAAKFSMNVQFSVEHFSQKHEKSLAEYEIIRDTLQICSKMINSMDKIMPINKVCLNQCARFLETNILRDQFGIFSFIDDAFRLFTNINESNRKKSIISAKDNIYFLVNDVFGIEKIPYFSFLNLKEDYQKGLLITHVLPQVGAYGTLEDKGINLFNEPLNLAGSEKLKGILFGLFLAVFGFFDI